MTDYEQLIKALRHCSHDGIVKCNECKYGGKEWPVGCEEELMKDAAAAIEDLQARLGEAENSVERWKDMYVTKHEPKLGEWQKAKPHGVVTYSDGYAECSHCHEAIWLGWWMNFCPHCGTQNKIIDPDDYDGAKMNDSNASNALNALDNAQDGPIITPCRGCSDYDGYGGCKSKGGCARAKMEVQDADN